MHIYRGLVLLSLFFACTPTALAIAPYGLELGRYRALVISNQQYQQLTPLRTPHKDAEALAKLLRDDYGFKVTLLQDADRKSTLDALDALVEKLTPQDNLLIFYAGHGHLDKATGEGYWLPVTANPRRRSEWISNSDITDTLRATRAAHVMVISDSCFSGTLTRGGLAGLNVGEDRSAYYHKLAKSRSRTALTSGGEEPVADGGANGHSVFAGALLSSLRANNEAVIEGEQIYQLLRRPVALNSTAQQNPTYSDVRATGHDGGDFIFFRKNARRQTTSTTAETDAQAGVRENAAYELAFWNSIEDSKDAADYQAYLQTYPQGQFAALANARLRKLQKSGKPASSKKAESPKTVASIARPRPATKPAKPTARGATVLVVRATPDSEYSPEFPDIEAYSQAVAAQVRKFYAGQDIIVLTDKARSRALMFESSDYPQSRMLCQEHAASRVMSIELNLSRDMAEEVRTRDVIYYAHFDCTSKQRTTKGYSVDFQLGEAFTYQNAIQRTLSQYDQAFSPLGK
jgi:uncharacterized caspase-like protein